MPHSIDRKKYFFEQYNQIQSHLYAFILMMVHNECDAEDLLQETSVILWERFEEFARGANFKAWAFAIAKNRTFVFLRKNKKLRLSFMDEVYEKIPAIAVQILEDQIYRVKALKHCINKLSPNDQQLLRMRYKENNVPKVLSQKTGRSLNGLYKSLTRVHSLLRDCIMRTLHLWEIPS
ncbi:MAG: sigma-70 family RNA polymerase sigma factor [Sedimentisphaerales bacterium]|nr:sigma-70 family RNA polymerase sigma factor [Sedimentisphaerales bacterium]